MFCLYYCYYFENPKSDGMRDCHMLDFKRVRKSPISLVIAYYTESRSNGHIFSNSIGE